MAKLTSADCVQEIVARCQDPRVVMAAYCGGEPSDYDDKAVVAEMLAEHQGDFDEEDYPTPQDFLVALVDTFTNKKNWKRESKYKENGCIYRTFRNNGLMDVSAIVCEVNGVIDYIDFETD